MTDNDNRPAAGRRNGAARNAMLEQLEAVLDSVGSNKERWPAAQRPALIQFAESDGEAVRLVQRSAAFEQVLAAAPTRGERATAELADLIMASARATPRLAANRPALAVSSPKIALARPTLLGSRWRELALLAASLLVGISIGASQTVGDYVQSMAAEVGVASEVPIAGLEDLWNGADMAEGVL